ncbi:hypothetical protein Tco_0716611 [Tanacetum coccineum]
MTQAQQRQYMATYLKNWGGWKFAQIKKLTNEELKEKFEYLMRGMERFVPMDTEKESRKRTGVELQIKSSKKLNSDTREDVSVPKEKDKELVKREEEFEIKKPVLRYTKRKSLARKGLQKKPESAKSGTEEDVEAYMEERVDEPSLEEFPMISIPQGPAPAKIVKLDDLKELYRLMMLKYRDNRPEEEFERILNWRYFHSCSVYCLTVEAVYIYMLTEVKYPLPPRVCKAMLEKKLLGDRKDKIKPIRVLSTITSVGVSMTRNKEAAELCEEWYDIDGFHKVILGIGISLENTKTSETAGQTNDENTEKPKSVSEPVVSNPKIDRDRVIIEDWNSDDEEEVSEVQTVRPETQTVKTRDDKSGQNSKKQGIGFRKVKACFVCKSTDHLIKDCNFHDKKSQEPKLKNVVNTGQREGKPVWDNTKRINHQNFSKYPHLSKTFVPSGVLTRTGLHRPSVSTARPVCTARPSVSTARPVCTARPSVSTARPVYAARPIYPRMDNVRPRGSCSPIKRSYYIKLAFRPKDLKQDVKTFGVQNMTTAGTRAVVNTSKGKLDTDLKKSRWVWRPKRNYLDHVSKDSGSFMLKKGNPEILLQDHAVVDSGCSSHMTGNKAYLSDYEDFNGGFVAFGSDPKGGKITGKGKIKTANLDFDDVYFVDELNFKLLDESQVVLRAPRKDDVYNLDLKNIVPSGGTDNANITRNRPKPDKHGHGNEKSAKEPGRGLVIRVPRYDVAELDVMGGSYWSSKIDGKSDEEAIVICWIPTSSKAIRVYKNQKDQKGFIRNDKETYSGIQLLPLQPHRPQEKDFQ